MRWALAAVACAGALVAVVVLAARGDADQRLTPSRPATLWSSPPSVGGPESQSGVLVGVRIRVGTGGMAGRLRVRALENAFDRTATAALGPSFTLPAAPGVYTFAAPRIHWDTRLSGL